MVSTICLGKHRQTSFWFKGAGGGGLSDRGGHGGHLAEKYCWDCSYPELSRLPCCDLAVVTRRWTAISAIISKQGFLTFKFLYFENHLTLSLES